MVQLNLRQSPSSHQKESLPLAQSEHAGPFSYNVLPLTFPLDIKFSDNNLQFLTSRRPNLLEQLPLADLGGVSVAQPSPYGTQFFHFAYVFAKKHLNQRSTPS